MLEQTSPRSPLEPTVARRPIDAAPSAPTDYASLFEAQVARTPRRPAITFEGRTMSYAEVNTRANRLAHVLVRRGVGPEVVVGVLLERSLEMVLILLAVQKAGGVCLPLDASYPAARISYMLEDSDASLVVTQHSLREGLRDRNEPTICVDVVNSTLSDAPTDNLERALAGSNAAQIMFTSGSTGRPKGVTLTHAGLVGFLTSMLMQPGMGEDDTILALANCTFDPSIVEIYQPLICGAHCVVIGREVAADGIALWSRVQTLQPTILNATPATFKMLIEAGWAPNGRDMKVVCGGETMSLGLAAELLARSSSVWNVYGPTEATALCAMHRVTEVDDPIPIGRAMPGVTLHILDVYGCAVGVGEPGELYIGGVGLTRGYLKRDDLTSEKFVRDPFSLDPAARLYRSGDLATWRADGTIILRGRVDDQVKLNGCRIEPCAVESVLESHGAVRQAVVAARDGRLVAWIVCKPGAEASDSQLHAHAAASLPEYMVPSLFVRLACMPLNANAKTNRSALLDMPLPAPAAAPSSPLTPLQARLAAAFARVLGDRPLSATQPFSTMGLDSLASVRIVRAVESELGCKLPLGLLLRARTLAQLADALGKEHELP